MIDHPLTDEGIKALPSLLTADEVAELLRVHRSTVYRWVDSGKLAALQGESGVIRIPRASLRVFFEQTA